MALGSAFPRDFVESQIRRRLKPGTVIKMRQTMDDGLIHEKRFVYDSKEVIHDLVEQPDWVLGSISTELRTSITAAIKFSPTLSTKEVTELCKSLSEE